LLHCVAVILRDHERSFGERRFRMTLALADELPVGARISAAHCLAFDGGRVLLVRHVARQWTIPGGRTEGAESAEQTMHREVMEEAAAVVADPVIIATECIDLLEGEPDPAFPPPPVHQVFFVARVVSLARVTANAETYESRLFPIDEARVLPGWIDHNGPLFEAACELARRRWPTSTT
jgi:8-oxo-dGTP pyrophosphatase MutT (NUDIX family)